MSSVAGLIVRLKQARAPDRRLDAEVVLALLQPDAAFIDPHEGLDGWDILRMVDGEAVYWREAGDILPVTASLDAVCELLAELRREDLAPAMLRGLRHIADAPGAASPSDVVGAAARSVLTALLRSVAAQPDTPRKPALIERAA